MAIRIQKVRPFPHSASFHISKTNNSYQAVLRQLRSFLDEEEPKLVLWLYRLKEKQKNTVTYRELRNALTESPNYEIFNNEWMTKWQREYAEFVNTYLAPEWINAMVSSSAYLRRQYPEFLYNPLTISVQEYVSQHGAEFVTGMAQEQKNALQALISRASSYDAVTPDELSRQIRPLMGLTQKQAIANFNYYTSMFENLRNETGLSRKEAEKRARESALVYAAKQHRQRAYTIARTELAAAYNRGAYDSTKKAQADGYLDECIKRWLTADDERVCSICGGLDEKVVDMDKPFNYKGSELYSDSKLTPPAHPNCRCSVIFEEIALK